MVWPLALVAMYVLSIGPMDWLVANDRLPNAVLYYQRPLYSVTCYNGWFDCFLDWYVTDVWGVYQPLLR